MVNLCACYERHTATTRLSFSRQVFPPPNKIMPKNREDCRSKKEKVGTLQLTASQGGWTVKQSPNRGLLMRFPPWPWRTSKSRTRLSRHGRTGKKILRSIFGHAKQSKPFSVGGHSPLEFWALKLWLFAETVAD